VSGVEERIRGRARLGRYALWQLRDFAGERGAAAVIVGALLGLQNVLQQRSMYGPRWASLASGMQVVGVIYQTVTVFGFVGVLLAVNGISATDRKRGYYRFLFSKPVSVPRYYAQAFLVNGVGLVVAAVVLLAPVALLVGTPDAANTVGGAAAGALAFVALVYVAVGGIGFLFSAVTRFDWLALSVTVVLSALLRVSAAGATGWRAALAALLPPVHRLDDVSAVLVLRRSALTALDLAWPLGYGLLALTAGLLVLRFRPLASP
jgi:hypothetical protein